MSLYAPLFCRDRAGESVEDVQRVHAVQSQHPAGRRRVWAGAVDLQEPGYSARRTAGSEIYSIRLSSDPLTKHSLLIIKSFHSDGEGLGSSFAIELPFYFRSMVNQAAAVLDSNVAIVPRQLQPRSHMGPVTVVRIAPYEHVPDMVVADDDAAIKGVTETLSILIVDDSSANRSGSPYPTIYLYRPVESTFIWTLLQEDCKTYVGEQREQVCPWRL